MRRIEAELVEVFGVEVGTVDCPSEVKVEPDQLFLCAVGDLRTEFANIKILNEEADLQILGVVDN